ncbi:unnamed protein product [Didymodactylos carnosus]|uniref:L-seryl-tRNA(Sec) kinase n=1 Tax=Didymodactylos carnosus TaxID=1234261 RepID=A0A813Y456_9BILA|nr:unnamed protein product [Didymodactylos carnosus]CAF0878084.1 unnamed protein product [Didymodactylos carnosus]CAF3639333.1 unnamed protein product [Didymodactylos carnosus]CAF3664703.1 unnamed protein product [Didymodactylos carnosus]
MTHVTLVLVCGPPASLKTTLINIVQCIINKFVEQNSTLRKLCVNKIKLCIENKFMQIDSNWYFINFDKILFNIETEVINESWKQYRLLIANIIEIYIKNNLNLPPPSNELKFLIDYSSFKYAKIIYDRIYQIFYCTKNIPSNNIIIVLEDNFYYHSMRYRYYQIAQCFNTSFMSIHLQCNIHTTLERNKKRNGNVTEQSIHNIQSKYELPDIIWEKNSMIIDTTYGFHLNTIIQFFQLITNVRLKPEKMINFLFEQQQQRDESTKINQTNVIHQTDQIIRKYISTYLKEKLNTISNVQMKKVYAENVNKCRMMFLEKPR